MAPPGYQEGAGGAGLNHASGNFQRTCSLGSLAGQTVTLKFTGTEDSLRTSPTTPWSTPAKPSTARAVGMGTRWPGPLASWVCGPSQSRVWLFGGGPACFG